MLVLIIVISGNIGSKLLDALIRRGHSVRGLGRDPQKLTANTRKRWRASTLLIIGTMS